MSELKTTRPRIAIPVPHSGDREYAERALPQYEEAVRGAGGEPVRIELDQTPVQVMKQIERCDAVLLPGSRADVDPKKYSADRHEKTASADAQRELMDDLLLQDAYNLHKPVLGICYGLQSLNVYRAGSLVQHIESPVNHEAGRKVPVAHEVEIDRGSRLAEVLEFREGTASSRAAGDPKTSNGTTRSRALPGLIIPANSSHHQSADVIGDGLKIVARCPKDGIIEAVEGTSPDHFVLAVQWHPERSFEDDERSRAIFRALVEAARQKHLELVGEFEGRQES